MNTPPSRTAVGYMLIVMIVLTAVIIYGVFSDKQEGGAYSASTGNTESSTVYASEKENGVPRDSEEIGAPAYRGNTARTAYFKGGLGYKKGSRNMTVLFACGERSLYALDAEKGKDLWRLSIPGGPVYSPIIAGGMIFVVSKNGVLHAVHAGTGARAWSEKCGKEITCGPSLAEGAVCISYYTGNEYFLEARQATTGKRI